MLFIKALDFSKRKPTRYCKRRPILSTAIIAVLAGGTAFSAALVVPYLRAALRHSPLTYEQCEGVTADTSRLACYDRIIGENSHHPEKQVRRPQIMSERP